MNPDQLLYSAEQTRHLDHCAIDQHGIPGFVLMGRAAAACHRVLCERWPGTPDVLVLCGGGNNGGDGYLLADALHKRARPVRVLELADPDRLRGDAAAARAQARDNGVEIGAYAGELPGDGVIVDAMLGTGLGGDVREPFAGAIEHVNRASRPVLSVDIPSGLCADTGRELGTAVRADATVTFIGIKQGLMTGRGPDLSGALCFDALGVPAEVYASVPDAVRLLRWETERALLPPPALTAHKGSNGRVLVVGGDYGMGGAAGLAGLAALRAGAGLVRVATRAEHVAGLLSLAPELMVTGVRSGLELEPLLAASDVVIVGPGLGQGPWGEQLLQQTLASGLPAVIDADALNLVAARSERLPANSEAVLTPHPGEAARLLGSSVAEVQADRFAAVSALREKFGTAALLKGRGSLIADDSGIALVGGGNPGMATAGMGDVLSGLTGGLCAQGLSPQSALRLAACLHTAAGDLAAGGGQRGLIATDVIAAARELLG